MKKIYIVGVILIAMLVGVVIGQNQGFVFAKDEAYMDREGYHYERCRTPREERRYLEDENQNRHYKRGHMHHREKFNSNGEEFDREFFNSHMRDNHRSRMQNQRCIR